MSREIRTLIVDDEPPARRRILSLLAAEQDFEVVGQAEDGSEAISMIRSLNPGLVFLDVQMPEADGFEVLATIGPQHMPAIIFVTAYDEFAVRAFEVRALDYLLKPFDRERFQHALVRARAQLRHGAPGDLDQRLASLLADLITLKPIERIPVRTGGRIRLVHVDEIDYITAEGNYARLHAGETSYLIRDTLTGLEARLDPERFIRLHRSCILNIDRVRELEPLFQGEYSIILHDGTRIKSGRTYGVKVRNAFNLS